MNSVLCNNRLRLKRAASLVGATALLGAGVISSSVVFAQAGTAAKLPLSLTIYRGDTLASSGMTVSAWGSGLVQPDPSKIYSGTESLRVTTHGLYQGADMKLAKAIDFAPLAANKYNYLTFAVALTATAGGPGGNPGSSFGSSGSGAFAGFGGVPGGGKGFGSGGPSSGSGGPGGGSGFPGSGGSSAAGAAAYGGVAGRFRPGGQVQAQENRKLENLRVVLVTTGGKAIEVMAPMLNSADENEWKIIAIPVSAISIPEGDTQIAEIRLFGDAPAVFNVGSIGVVEDATPIVVRPLNDKTVQRLAKYQYVASASAGVTPLVYTWDWDAADGIQEEAQGRGPTHIFRKASVDESLRNTDYIVTVTVTDYYKIKAPVKTSFKVHVTP